MKLSRSIACATALLGFAIGSLYSGGAAAQATQSGTDAGPWQFTATIYGWVPIIDGKANFPDDKGSTNIHVNGANVISHLKMTFQGSLDAHNGRWGIFNDLVYVDLGGVKQQNRDFSIGNVGIPASATTDLTLDLKSLIWTVAGEYRVLSDSAWTLDLLGGARELRMKPTLGYSITGDLGPIVIPGRSGSKQVDEKVWDGIVGVKGRYAFGAQREWSVPFYLDVGTGQSNLTWQGATGISYAFKWGELSGLWRYLAYDMKSGRNIRDFNFNGPMVGATFRW